MVSEKDEGYFGKSSISKRLMFWLTFITLIVVMIFGAINYYLFVNQLEEDLDIRLEETMMVLGEDLGLHMWNLDVDSLIGVADSHSLVKSLSFLQVSDNFDEAIHEMDDMEEGMDYAFKKDVVLYEGEDVGVIEIAFSRESVELAKGAIIRSTFVIILAVFFTVLVISFLISRSISRPIRKIAEVSQEIAGGNLDKKVEIDSEDEVGRLGVAFNAMTSKLKESYMGLEEKVKKRTAELEKKKNEAVKQKLEMAEMRTASLSMLEDVEEARTDLEKSNRLKDLFMDIMRHDLLNPAGVVQMNSQLALSEEKDVKKRKPLESIERNSKRMVRMIENASILAKLESGEKIEFTEEDLGVMLKGSVDELSERSKERGIKVKVVAGGKFLAVVNPLIQNIFSNFIANAIKYGPEKAEIIAGIKERDSDNWVVYVEDRGQGIPNKDKKTIFERFSRLEKGAVKGTGLGLAISKKIIGAHGGKIWVADRKGKGSIFYALIPKRHGDNAGLIRKTVAKPITKATSRKTAIPKVKKVKTKRVTKITTKSKGGELINE